MTTEKAVSVAGFKLSLIPVSISPVNGDVCENKKPNQTLKRVSLDTYSSQPTMSLACDWLIRRTTPAISQPESLWPCWLFIQLIGYIFTIFFLSSYLLVHCVGNDRSLAFLCSLLLRGLFLPVPYDWNCPSSFVYSFPLGTFWDDG